MSEVASPADRVRPRYMPPLFLGLRHQKIEEKLTAIIDEFEEKTGEPPSFFHLNDSEERAGIQQGSACTDR